MAPIFYPRQAVGSRARIIVGEEAEYATAPHSAGYAVLPCVSQSLVLTKNSFVSETLNPNRRIPDIVVGNQRTGGDIVVETVVNKPYTLLLAHLLGELNEQGVATSALGGNGPATAAAPDANGFYTHSLQGSVELGDGIFEGLTIEAGFLDIQRYFAFRGCRINSLRLEVPNEGIVRSTFGILGAIADEPSTESLDQFPIPPTPDTGLTPLTSFQAVVEEGGDTIAFLRSVNLEITNNLNGDNFVVGQDVRANLLPGRRGITGTAEFLFVADPTLALDAIDLYDRFIQNTASSLRLTMARNGTHFANGGASAWGIDFYFPQIKYAGGSPTPTVPNDGPLTITLPFQAIDSAADDTDVIVTVVNKESDVHIF